mmetsp:Transcript_33361/g.103987  ORF Transcript_33361/g.103987 Transcript_33361/m.103987 type:complete len:236 (+) Transcript_33361:3-710(+)
MHARAAERARERAARSLETRMRVLHGKTSGPEAAGASGGCPDSLAVSQLQRSLVIILRQPVKDAGVEDVEGARLSCVRVADVDGLDRFCDPDVDLPRPLNDVVDSLADVVLALSVLEVPVDGEGVLERTPTGAEPFGVFLAEGLGVLLYFGEKVVHVQDGQVVQGVGLRQPIPRITIVRDGLPGTLDRLLWLLHGNVDLCKRVAAECRILLITDLGVQLHRLLTRLEGLRHVHLR